MAVAITERAEPWCVRRRTAFAAALAEGTCTVEGVTARRFATDTLGEWDRARCVAVLVHPDSPHPPSLHPDLLVDARVLKHGHDTTLTDAARVIGVGPGFSPQVNCHAAVETARGHDLGRVLYSGRTRPFDGVPGELGGERSRRVLRAAGRGRFHGIAAIGDEVDAGTPIGRVDGAPVRADIAGVLRGLLADGTPVRGGQKVGDVDPRGDPALCAVLSDKANAVGGGVVEAALVLLRDRSRPSTP